MYEHKDKIAKPLEEKNEIKKSFLSKDFFMKKSGIPSQDMWLSLTMMPYVQGGRRADLLEAVRQILPAVHCVALPVCVYHHPGCRSPPAPLQQEIVAAKKVFIKVR